MTNDRELTEMPAIEVAAHTMPPNHLSPRILREGSDMQIKDSEISIRLQFSSGRPPVTNLADVNDALAPFGSRLRPLDLGSTPADVQELLKQAALSDIEVERAKAHFLLSRERLLNIIVEAGRKPQVPGGGEMTTLDSTHNITYPRLDIVGAGVDYSRFDRFHVNTADDGTGVDEIMQILSGGGVRLLQHLPDKGLVTLHIACPAGDAGWILTYDGAYPHIGSISGARPGTKVLMQAIGPSRWATRYEEVKV
jgi:hypothetical protein